MRGAGSLAVEEQGRRGEIACVRSISAADKSRTGEEVAKGEAVETSLTSLAARSMVNFSPIQEERHEGPIADRSLGEHPACFV